MRSALDRAGREAQRLGHGVFGPEHVVVALLTGEDCPARRALHETGLTQEVFEARFVEPLRDAAPAHDGSARSTPRYLAVRGAAQAFAAMGGRRSPDSTDVLLGVLYADAWTPSPLAGDELDGGDAEGEPVRIIAALRLAGVPVPSVPPPEQRPWRNPCSTALPASLADAVMRLLVERHPGGRGPHWGFNHVNGRHVIIHDAELDVVAIITEATDLASSGAGERPGD